MATDSTDTTGLQPPHRSHHLVGHDAALALLGRAFMSGRMPHAWMICGPTGIGKATLAFRVARYILAHGGSSGHRADPGRFDVAPEAPAARKIGAHAHPDLLTIERPPVKADEGKSVDEERRKAPEIPVDIARRIPPFLHRTPAEGGWRIVIVDEADSLNRNAANAILKVIEEPPRQALIFLVCNRPGAMLPTIRSRCRRLLLSAPGTADVADLLTGSDTVRDRQQAMVLGQLADGSPGKAIELHEGDSVGLFRSLTETLGQGARLDIQAASRIADRVSRPAAEADYRAFETVTTHLVSRILRSAATGLGGAGMLESEEDIVAAGARGGLDPWLQVWEKMGRLFASADRVHLDRRQIALNVMMMLDEALRQ